MSTNNSGGSPVFFDEKGKRGKRTYYVSAIVAVIVTVMLSLFVISVLVNPFLPQFKLKPIAALPSKTDLQFHAPELPVTPKEAAIKKIGSAARNEKAERQEKIAALQYKTAQPNRTPVPGGKPLSIGFYVNWDDSSLASLRQNYASLDWLVPEWIRLSGDTSNPLVLDIDEEAVKFIKENKPEMPIMPLIQNYKNEQWNSDILVPLISTEAARKSFIQSIIDTLTKNGFGGATIDIEEVPASSQADLFAFMSELHSEFAKRGLVLSQAVPFDNPDWNYKAYASVTDYLMLMAYDQHWSTGKAGPVAGQDWFDSIMKKRMAELSPAQTIVCIGNYGYNWSDDGSEAETVSFQEALIAARESLDSPGDIKFDPESKNPYFTYSEDDGSEHSVWFLDSVTAFNQIKSAGKYSVAGYALWRMGSEDPSLWKVFGSAAQLDPNSLASIDYGYDVDFRGTGEILQVIAKPQQGKRTLTAGADGEIDSQRYDTIPSSYVIQRTGDVPGTLALTFDDGPDPVWTPKILDILKEKGVKATFFIVGENGQTNPQLVKRIVADGNEIGNHSFTHPNLAEVPAKVTDVELNATQRLIESLTGRSTRLFRAPYFGDAEPRTPDEVDPTVQAQDLGYISVGLHVDPDDWKLTNDDGTPHTADQMVDEVVKQASITTAEERGSVILMHDAGGDRSATVAALPRIIDELRAKGFKFATVGEIAGMTPDEVMPPVPSDHSFYSSADAYVFYGLSIAGWLMRCIFWIGIILGLGRMAIIGLLALAQWLRSRRREETHFGEGYSPLVSVIVPAYNEEKVVANTVRSLLRSEYQNYEIIVVDDGSTDGTMAVLEKEFAGTEKVQLHTKPNGGKAAAINHGISLSKGEIIVSLDADTIFEPQTLGALAHRFADEKVGAVAGNAKVGNRINIVTKWQALEYVTSQNFDRRAFASLNCITVVPGSVGAWRRSVIEAAGGFTSDTLAEDQDLTIKVRKLGYHIGYEEEAIGLTEAPATLRELSKQRFRWSFGTLQCMWKHKNALLNPKYGSLGFIAMPNVWIFQIIFPLISPFMDLIFIWTLISAGIGALEHQEEFAHTPSNLNEVIFFYALFLAVDFIGAMAAFMMERREQKSLLAWLLIQRFGYRQVMYSVMVRSVFTAIKGAVVGWGKLERKATVSAAQ